ncbi:hypothetical protein ACFR9U_17220 [Halorientalis brevis]|uniref:Uncharacterized protein n=1 Tax=Halorientalis brevis TaxID=1126241 RepID=A0ABD6CEL0_9EURY|nr:hypothetical protein [Halorientalis brevis]
MGGLLDGAADAYDNFAEGLSRSAQRQFDDTPGGGFADLDTYLPGQSPGEQADVSDHTDDGILTAPPEETSQGPVYQVVGSIPRQFDDRPDGGFADEAIDLGGDVATDAAKAGTPAWMNPLIEHPFMTVGAALVLFLFISAGGPSEIAEAGGASA